MLETAIAEQQRIFMKQGSLDTNKVGFYVMAMPSDELASLCVIHMMRHLLGEFLNNTNKDAERFAQTRELEVDFSSLDVKIMAVKLFQDLGSLVDRQLKKRLMDKELANQAKTSDSGAREYDDKIVEKHLLVDDYAIGTVPKNMQIKIGAYMTNLMCKNLRFKCGNHKFMLLKPQVTRGAKKVTGAASKKYIGYITYNKAFVEDFISQLDKSHDLNL